MSAFVLHKKLEPRGQLCGTPFDRMLAPEALKISYPYNKEEERFLREMLSTDSRPEGKSLIVVGAGPLWYLELALRHGQSYVAVDPLVKTHIDDRFASLFERSSNVTIIEGTFEKLRLADMPEGGKVFVFPFNVLAYIKSPADTLAMLIRPGDTVFVSTWAKSERAAKLRSDYVEFLEGHEGSSSMKLYDLDGCGIAKLPGMIPLARRKGKICETTTFLAG